MKGETDERKKDEIQETRNEKTDRNDEGKENWRKEECGLKK